MKIAIVTDAWTPQVNGVVRTLQATGQELAGLGHEVDFITPSEFRTVPCPTYPEIRLAIAPRIAITKRLDRLAPDVIHICTEGPLGWAARRYCRTRGIRYTTSFHTKFAEYVQARCGLPARWTYAWLRRFHSTSHSVMAGTPAVLRELTANGFERVQLWSRGVDLSAFKPAGPVRKLHKRGPIFLYVGRVAVEKNVEAFLQLDLPGSKWVVGGGPQLAELQGRYPNVSFAGQQPRERLPAYYRAADVFVFPSRTDTFGLVLLEAMACGTPVAAYPVTGPIDVVGDGGVLHDDLRFACMSALQIPRDRPLTHAQRFSWRAATAQFVGNLAPPQRAMQMV
ncbi:MAG: glycosyltransferase family 4 protein [Burkholderiales bacterium]